MNDEELMAEINAIADKAADARPDTMDRDALAGALAEKSGYPAEEIAAKLTDVWRSRGLFFATVHR